MTDVDEFPALIWFSQTEALAYLHQMDAATDIERPGSELLACHERMRQMGFRTLNYVAFETIGRRVLRAHAMSELADVSFSRLYWKHRLYESDPRFVALRQNGLPARWQATQIEAHAEHSGDPRVRILSNSLRSRSMNAGLMLSLPAPRQDLRVAVNLTAETHEVGWINDRVVGGALTIALTVHRLVQPYVDECARRNREMVLTNEQAAVLQRLVKGLSDQEIATAMSTSLHKVSSHVKALQKMFNVENRAQLVYRAARWGWSG
ncbi:LuxR C-terminal-related transcriptional regulator [Trinickia sp. LjRoot230]|uniref:helix-turn-helix transcriptional regulator n=1 Tax=Trinickia sp. LjRoot230 TaxID=3342288 RepID=UPI003ED0EB3C